MAAARPPLPPAAALAALLVLLARGCAPHASPLDAAAGLLRDGRGSRDAEPPDVGTPARRYDFVIVGAGTAGCVLANRLSEHGKFKVLLVEAGDRESFLMDVPLLATMLQFTAANWDYSTEPQRAGCAGMRQGRCRWPRGKVVGGSSVLHSMMHTRGNRRDYDRWAAAGNPGWNYDSVLHYFKKSENMAIPELARDTRHHSTRGEMHIQYPDWRTKLSDAFLKAGVETGGSVVDYNGATQTGYSLVQFTIQNGTRMSASRAFLHRIGHRRNFHILKNAMVTKVLIDPDTMRAYGVNIVRHGKEMTVMAKREVIVSAGTINSPQLLMISGVGPRAHLMEKGIPVLRDLPVGYNLQDHQALGGLTFLINTTDSFRTERIMTFENIMDYLAYHTGPLSAPSGPEALAFIDTRNPDAADGYPDLELLFVAGSLVSNPATMRAFGLNERFYNQVYGPIAQQETWMVFPMLLLPHSTGRVMLRDKNPFSKPVIFANYFSDGGHDERVILYGIRKAIELSKTRAFQKFGSRLHDIPLPNCARHGFNTDEYWFCAMKTITSTIYHHTGTCKMGPPTDPGAVVDPRLRVHGVRGLRVVDASVMPWVPAAHTNAPTLMVAEKAADMIKEDWGVRSYDIL